MSFGVILVIQPPILFTTQTGEGQQQLPHDTAYFFGALLALGAAIAFGGYNVFLAGALEGASPLLLIFYIGITGIILAVCVLPLDDISVLLSAKIGKFQLK